MMKLHNLPNYYSYFFFSYYIPNHLSHNSNLMYSGAATDELVLNLGCNSRVTTIYTEIYVLV